MGSAKSFNLSIRSRLTAYIGIFAFLVLAVASTAIVALSSVDRDAESVNQKWLAGTRILGELGDRVSEFRLAETYRALAADAAAAAAAEEMAIAHRNAIEDLVPKYISTVGADQPEGDVLAFTAAWRDYLIVHDAWLRADVYGRTRNLARSNSSLHWRYKVVDQAVEQLKSENFLAADRQTAAAGRLAQWSKTIVSLASVVAILLAAYLTLKIRATITKPLGSITHALSQLAGGSLGVRVPGMEREDEIGEMAKAFDVFRANAAELDKAHAETRAAQEHADSLARHDALTGLPNRRVFGTDLATALARIGVAQAYFTVMLIDLDKFKSVNDVQGHSVGDQVLCEVARRLLRIVAVGGTVARLGGDEFAFISEPKADMESAKSDAVTIAAHVLQALRVPIHVPSGDIEIGASIGIACCPADGSHAEDILRAADLAMYRAKQDGRDTFRFFEQSMDDELRGQVALDESLRRALRSGGIRPYYQPLVDIKEGDVFGFEVLARWNHEEQGFISPDRFIAMAERLGLIADLTYSILRQACQDARHWGDDIRLAVNISPLQLKDLGFPLKILTILQEENFNPTRLEIEITESALVGDIDMARTIITAFQSAGIAVSLDDFGTGYSSLYHLRNLKFDKLKIDRSFVQSLQTNAESQKIIDAVLSLARSLGMPVIAEGIEHEAARSHLAERGCDYGQGYLFSRAVDAEAAGRLLSERDFRLSA